MIHQMKAILKTNSIGVLATSAGNIPHCSLMAYITDTDGDRLFFVTLKQTRKFTTMIENPSVSFLIDTRMSHLDRHAIQALTVSGKCTPVPDPSDASQLLTQLTEHHPHLIEIIKHPDAVVMECRIESMQLLNGPVEQHIHHVAPVAQGAESLSAVTGAKIS